MTAAEGRHEPGGIRLPAQRQGGQPQAGHPAFGAGRQRRHRRGGQVSTSRFAEQRRRLSRGEPQVGGAQLGQLPASPQPGQRQRRVGPAGQHQMQAWGQVLQQERQRRVHRLGVDQVVVIEDQQHLAVAGLGGQLVDQRRHQPLEGCRRQRAQQQADSLPDPRAHPVQRGQRVTPEPHRVVVGCVQRQPGHRPVARRGQVGQQGRLTGPGRGTHQDQPPRQPFTERLYQRGRGTKPGCRRGTCSLVASRPSCPDTAAPRGATADGSAISDPPSAGPATAGLAARRSHCKPSPTGQPGLPPVRLSPPTGRHLAPVAGRVRAA